MHASSSATVHVAMITIVCLACSEVFRSENIYRQNLPGLMWNILRATSLPSGGSKLVFGRKKGQSPRALAVGDKVIYAVTTALRRVVRPTFFAVRTSLQARPFCQP